MSIRAFSKPLGWSRNLPVQLCYAVQVCRTFSRSAPFGKGTYFRPSATGTTNDRQAPIPSFKSTSSKELNDLLTAIRTKIILPKRMTKEQRKLIYMKTNIPKLSSDPISIDVVGERFPLQHINRLRDVPPLHKSFRKIITELEPQDWDMVGDVCAAYREANGSVLPTSWMVYIAMEGFKKGQGAKIMDLARRAADTGYFLRDFTVVKCVLVGIRKEVVAKDWQKEDAIKAISRIEQIFELLERDNSRGGTRKVTGRDPRQAVEIMGHLLEATAMHCYRNCNAKDVNGKVALYASRLIGFNFDIPAEARSFAMRSESERWSFLSRFTPVVHGIEMTAKILGEDSEIVQLLQSKAKTMRELVREVETAKVETESPPTATPEATP